MLSNLMENELRYAGANAQISINVSAQGSSACITVEDDGPGFSPDLLPRVFQRFVKGRESEGHGLGLAFVSAVAGAHAGRAVARNRSTQGAQIVVELPIATAHPTEERQIADNLLTSH
jgi:signal transduction histidine kinase